MALLTRDEVCRRLSISERSFYRVTARSGLRPARTGTTAGVAFWDLNEVVRALPRPSLAVGLLTSQQVSKAFGCDAGTLRAAVHSGQVKARRGATGYAWFFDPEAFRGLAYKRFVGFVCVADVLAGRGGWKKMAEEGPLADETGQGWLTTGEVAARFSCNERRVRSAVQAGLITPVKVIPGRARWFTVESVRKLAYKDRVGFVRIDQIGDETQGWRMLDPDTLFDLVEAGNPSQPVRRPRKKHPYKWTLRTKDWCIQDSNPRELIDWLANRYPHPDPLFLFKTTPRGIVDDSENGLQDGVLALETTVRRFLPKGVEVGLKVTLSAKDRRTVCYSSAVKGERA